MRAALWLVGLFAVAVASALLAGHNQSTVSIFWSPYRIDLSLNLTLLLMVVLFLLLHWAFRALAALLDLPEQARRWRMVKKERAMHAAVLDAVVQLMTGRFLRSVKSAEKVIDLQKNLSEQFSEKLSSRDQDIEHGVQLQALSHLIAAESAHALSDQALRQAHFDAVISVGAHHPSSDVQDAVEATLLRAARWALRERQPQQALQWLAQLPVGTARRTLALRLRLKAARWDQQSMLALETARLLAKHGAFSGNAADSLLRELSIEVLKQAQDASQLERAWATLEMSEKAMADVGLYAARRLQQLQGADQKVVSWLMPLWNQMLQQPQYLTQSQRYRLVWMLSQVLTSLPMDHDWLNSVERARVAYPRWAELQFLAGMVCWSHSLWGKAQQMLEQAAAQLDHLEMQRLALCKLALLAEQKGDTPRAHLYWRRAAELTAPER
jgi:HemY protein